MNVFPELSSKIESGSINLTQITKLQMALRMKKASGVVMKLEDQRLKMMSKPINNREIRVFQVEPSYQSKFDQQFNEEKEFNNED